ncbi:DUF6588 family protein [Croceitalea dokdonensis]|nr:DUF6588 family protein [Croceitalea dokdonensis]
MKTIFSAVLLVTTLSVSAQNLGDLLTSGLNDAERFANAYTAPATEAVIYGLSSGWYNSADAKPLGGFEISVIGNFTGFKNKEDKRSFTLNVADYENIRFSDGSQSKQVSTALGDIEGVEILVEDSNGLFSEPFELPAGLSAEGIDFVPSGFIQGSVGLFKGLEVKARFLPKVKNDDVAIGLLGAGLQYDFTKLLPADKLLPVAISAVVGYTSLTGDFNLNDTNVVDGENQRLETNFNTWNFSAVVSTRNIPVINFYGALGYVTGTSNIDVLGTYRVTSGPFQQTYTDPFSLVNDVNGVVATLGTKLKLGFFRINVDYNMGEFNTLTAGVNFGFR